MGVANETSRTNQRNLLRTPTLRLESSVRLFRAWNFSLSLGFKRHRHYPEEDGGEKCLKEREILWFVPWVCQSQIETGGPKIFTGTLSGQPVLLL